MARIHREATICDRCQVEYPESQLSIFTRGTRLGSHDITQWCSDGQAAMFCPDCVASLLGIHPRVEERVVYVDRDPESRRGSGGATGRPFVVGGQTYWSELSQTAAWSTLQPSSSLESVSCRGLAKSPSASGVRSGLLGRLLSCLTPET